MRVSLVSTTANYCKGRLYGGSVELDLYNLRQNADRLMLESPEKLTFAEIGRNNRNQTKQEFQRATHIVQMSTMCNLFDRSAKSENTNL